jgi:hypothetical protein
VKIITIGDLHGSNAWKDIDPELWDRIIFIGDYVDSRELDSLTVLSNLEEIIQFKKTFPDKVILLWGNHDLAYFYGGHERHYCLGFKKKLLPIFYSVFTSNRQLFHAAWQTGSYLWTHAGIAEKWYDLYLKEKILPADKNLADSLNRLFNEYFPPLYLIGAYRGGLHESGGIFWADRIETRPDPLRGYNQIVGHTQTGNGILIFDNYSNDTSITCVDCLETKKEFFELIINE